MIGIKKVVFVNSLTFLGKSIIEFLLTNKEIESIYLIEEDIQKDAIKDFSNNPKITIITSSSFFKNLRQQSETLIYDTIIYNAIGEELSNAQTIDKIAEYKLLLEKALHTNLQLLTLTPLNEPASRPTNKKVDFIESVIALTEEYRQNNLRGKLLALGEVYGPHMDLKRSNTPFNQLILGAAKEKTIELTNDKAFAYYIYIDDAIAGIHCALELQETGIFTLADPYDASLASIATRLSEITGKTIEKKLENSMSIQDHIKNLPYILPGWVPSVSFEKGLEKTLLWIQSEKPIRNMRPFIVNDISSDYNVKRTIRNYPLAGSTSGRNSVFNDVDKTFSVEAFEMSKSKAPVKNIDSIKERLGEETTSETSKRGNQRIMNPFAQGGFYTKRRLITAGLIIALSAGLYIFILTPGVKAFSDYIAIKRMLAGDTTVVLIDPNVTQKIQDTSTDAKIQLHALSKLFLLTGQQSRYDNLLATFSTLHDIGVFQQSYARFLTLSNTMKADFPMQNAQTHTSITALAVATQVADALSNNNALLQQELQGYNPFFPVKALDVLTLLKNEAATATTQKLQDNVIYSMFQGSKKYLLVTISTNDPLLSTKNISTIETVSFQDGVYSGAANLSTTLQKSVPFSSFDVKEFSLYLEHALPGTFNGVFIIKGLTLTYLKKELLTTSSQLFSSALLTNITGGNTQVIKSLQSALAGSDINIYLNNSLFTKSDIIQSLQ